MEIVQPHIRISSELAAEYALLPGDPGRVEKVAKYLENAQEVAYHREYKTVVGWYKGVKLLVTSTGIGGASAGIAVEELKNVGVKAMIRIGSCGTVQPHIKLGDLILAAGAVRHDGASVAYIEKGYPAIPDPELYIRMVDSAKKLDVSYHCGIVRSHDSFYTDEEEQIDQYWGNKGVLASDMETSALFVIGGLRKVKVASILNVVVESEGDLESGINDYVDQQNTTAQGEENMIVTALETLVAYSQDK
ncbi:nucleoside phosphorylase [Risungbinella massiliensis]|uniref:nucleoside phosphorylase n=1 Tax=Risungbinella massiliensis TaxID=1329796 RepID=UPI0005CC5B95|nr:nucleoside phosphorylase [Risungbinella massiliensis]